jgi:hypothetical protein
LQRGATSDAVYVCIFVIPVNLLPELSTVFHWQWHQ